MRVAALFLIAGILCAAENDPFSAYHDAIEQQLTTLAEQPRAVEPIQRTPDPVPAPSPGSRIDEFARKYWNGREADLRSALTRLARYRPELESGLEREGLPRNLIAVVLVESAAQPFALSPKQARGLWQFIPATARQYGLTVTASRDERVYTEPATRAAARYLRDLYTRFGDWSLALAAYNAGPDAVDRAIERGKAATYISAAPLLPAETRNYVPAVLAAMDLLGFHQLMF